MDSRYKPYNSDSDCVSRSSDGEDDYYVEDDDDSDDYSYNSDSDFYISISNRKGKKKGRRDKQGKKNFKK